MKPHKHAELIKAWADGAEIQIHMAIGWTDCNPTWIEGVEYRIKPEPKPDFIYVLRTYMHTNMFCMPHFLEPTNVAPHNLRLVYDGETGKLKSAEVLHA
jgi:hypothetical protein